MIFPEMFVNDLFDPLSGIETITSIEPYGYSIEAERLYEFSSTYQPSVIYRGDNHLQNYPGWADVAELDLTEEKRLKAPGLPKNETSTNRIFSYIAARKLAFCEDIAPSRRSHIPLVDPAERINKGRGEH